MSWFSDRRMEWIAETLRVFGFIQRQHLMLKFDISTPQASHDLQEFMRRNPGVMTYDSKQKLYVSNGGQMSTAVAKAMKAFNERLREVRK